jgi:hypothetical protein
MPSQLTGCCSRNIGKTDRQPEIKDVAAILEAMRADSIPEGKSERWSVRKVTLEKDAVTMPQGKLVKLPAGRYTKLLCYTMKCAMRGGETVMEDSPQELQTHLEFAIRARGRVLITGLGLGCVIRGCLLNPRVEHITCIERSRNVMKLVSPYLPSDRLTIIHADAIKWVPNHTHDQFDCAWHDLWTNTEEGEPHLQVWHSQLMATLVGHVGFQGAWAFPREQRIAWRKLAPIL